MDEELRVALMQAAIQQKKAGASDEQINQALFQASKGRIINAGQLLPPREGPAPAPRQQGDTPGAVATAGLAAADMALFGLGDELVQLVRGEEAGEEFRARRGRGQEAHPIASIAGGAAGLLAGPGAAAGRVLAKAVPAAGRAAAGLLGRGAARAGGGEVVQTLARGAGQVAGRVGAGAGAGAAEGGLLGAATAEIGERAEGAAGGAVAGGLLGGAAGGLSSLGGLRRALKAGEGGSQRLAEGVERGAQVPGRGNVRDQIAAARREAQEAFQQAETSGPVAGAADVIRQNPAARETLERIGTAESRKLASQIRKFEAAKEGEEVALPEISFGIVDEIRKSLGREASAFARRVPGARGAIPSQSQVREAEAAVGQLESILDDVPGFRAGMQASARGGALGRALEDGERLFTRPIADVERLFEGNPLVVGTRRIQPPGGANELAALRRGMADKLLTRLNKGDQSVPSFLKSLETGTDLRRRMRLILGSDEALDGFLAEARQESANLTTAKVAQLVAKYGSFALLGSSLLGGGVELL